MKIITKIRERKKEKELEKRAAEWRKEREVRETTALNNLYSKNSFIKSLRQTDETPFYDTTWSVETSDATVSIVLRDGIRIENVCKLLINVKSIADILAFDEREHIYYD